jgi:cytochrome b561
LKERVVSDVISIAWKAQETPHEQGKLGADQRYSGVARAFHWTGARWPAVVMSCSSDFRSRRGTGRNEVLSSITDFLHGGLVMNFLLALIAGHVPAALWQIC